MDNTQGKLSSQGSDASQIIILKVEIRPIDSSKTIRFETHLSLRELILLTLKKAFVSEEKIDEKYVIYVPRQGVYMENFSVPVSSLGLQDNDVIEIRNKPCNLRLISLEGQKNVTVKVDLCGSSNELVQMAGSKFSYNTTEIEIELVSSGTILDPNTPLIHQNVVEGSFVRVRKRQKEKGMAKLISKTSNAATKQVSNIISAVSAVTGSTSPRGDIGKKLVFGQPLVSILCQNGVRVHEIPPLVDQAIRKIEETALKVEGIFRLSGSLAEIERLRDAFDEGEEPDLFSINPHTVCGLLKLYLRNLPEPLLTFELYNDFTHVWSSNDLDESKTHLKALLRRLPPENYALLKRLMLMFRKVVDHSEYNKMAPQNLATVFGPNLLRQKEESVMQIVEDTSFVFGITNFLIKYNSDLFDFSSAPSKELLQSESNSSLSKNESNKNSPNNSRNGSALPLTRPTPTPNMSPILIRNPSPLPIRNERNIKYGAVGLQGEEPEKPAGVRGIPGSPAQERATPGARVADSESPTIQPHLYSALNSPTAGRNAKVTAIATVTATPEQLAELAELRRMLEFERTTRQQAETELWELFESVQAELTELIHRITVS